MTTEDEKLRDEYARLRRIDARRAPSFDAMREAARTPKVRPLRPAIVALIPLVAAAALLFLVFKGPLQDAAPAAAPKSQTVALAQDGAEVLPVEGARPEPLPLDFLLQTHAAYTDLEGSDFLLRVPTNPRGRTP